LWDELFDLVGAEMPRMRIKYRKKKEGQPEYMYTPPYFNAGLISINAHLANELFKTWMSCYETLISKELLEHPRYSEQVALTLAVHKMNIPYNILNKDYSDLPFLHYFSLIVLKNNTKAVDLVKSILNQYPEIKELIRNNEKWKFVFFSFLSLLIHSKPSRHQD